MINSEDLRRKYRNEIYNSLLNPRVRSIIDRISILNNHYIGLRNDLNRSNYNTIILHRINALVPGIETYMEAIIIDLLKRKDRLHHDDANTLNMINKLLCGIIKSQPKE